MNGRCHGGKRWAPHHLTCGLDSFLCPLGFGKGRIGPSSGTTARDCEALAVCPKSRLGPAHSSELFGDGAQNWGGGAPSRNLSGPSAFQEELSWPRSALNCIACSQSWAWLPVGGAVSSLTSLSTPGLSL